MLAGVTLKGKPAKRKAAIRFGLLLKKCTRFTYGMRFTYGLYFSTMPEKQTMNLPMRKPVAAPADDARVDTMSADLTTHDPVQLSHADIKSIIFGLMLAMLLAALDQTIVATAMPTIGRQLGDIHNLPWVVTAYLLTSTAVTPLYGKLSDIHGRRIVLLVAIAIFTLASAISALAPTMLVLIIARGLQGLGGGGLIALAQTIIADMMAPRERARYQVYIASVFVTSSIGGPLLGGFFAQHLHWSLIFWINLPLGLAAFLMTNSRLKLLPVRARPHKVDLTGAALLIVATVFLLLALSWGGVEYAWTSRQIIALVAGSGVLWVGFVVRLLTADEPLIPLAVLKNQVVATGMLAACFGMGTLIGLTIYMPIYLVGVLQLSPTNSGVALIPLMVGTVMGATLSGRVMAHMEHYKRLPLIGLSCSVVSTLVLALQPTWLNFALFEGLLAIISLGLGTLLPVATVSIQNAVAAHDLGTATAAMNFFRSLGGALIVAIFGAIVLATMHGSSNNIAALSTAMKADLAQTFRYVYGAAGIGLGIATAFLAAMHELPLRSKSDTATLAALEG